MESDSAVEMLRGLRDEASSLPPSVSSAEFNSWQQRTFSVLRRSLGKEHHITETFGSIKWTPGAYALGDTEAFTRAFRATVPEAQGLIDAAVFELDQLQTDDGLADGLAFDVELWEHVSAHVAGEQWGTVASQTAIFTEDRIRKWAGRPAEEIGQKLMTAVFGDKGDYRLGLTDGEKEGWHRLAMGVSLALRNADAHRIQDRTDHKRYAMGVLGVSSLLLTQMRYEHGNRFHDTSKAGVEGP
jgi:hypothetical protein